MINTKIMLMNSKFKQAKWICREVAMMYYVYYYSLHSLVQWVSSHTMAIKMEMCLNWLHLLMQTIIFVDKAISQDMDYFTSLISIILILLLFLNLECAYLNALSNQIANSIAQRILKSKAALVQILFYTILLILEDTAFQIIYKIFHKVFKTVYQQLNYCSHRVHKENI